MLFETLETRSLTSATLPSAGLTAPLTSAVAPAATVVAAKTATATATASAATTATYGLTAEQKRVVEQITSTFENSTTTLQYAFCEDIGDGRGYTAGRAGFCTGTGDFLQVVQRYTTAKPGNGLAKYLPRLREIAAEFADNGYADPVGDTDGLDGIDDAWHAAAADATFRAAQDAIVDAAYYTPAMNYAKTLGLNTALAKGQMYDAIIQHGDGDDHDGLAAMIARANTRSGGTPATGVSETTWLRNFLAVRRTTLLNATDPATREAWAGSVSRVDVYITLLNQGNTGLTGKLTFTVYGDTFTVQGVAAPAPPPPAAKGSISGQVYMDANKSGTKQASEKGAAGRVVFIDKDGDHYLDTNEVRTTTDANGRYTFTGLAAGSYVVHLTSTNYTFSSTPISKVVAVKAGQDTGNVLFGEFHK
jgi:chitosanase